MLISKRAVLALAFFSLAMSSPLAAKSGLPSPAYVSPKTVSPELLPPPPAEGSTEWKQNIESVLATQQLLSPVELSALRDEQKVRIELITSLLGTNFNAARLPKTFRL